VAYLTLLQVTYTDGDPEVYTLPLAWAIGERLAEVQGTPLVLARLRLQGGGDANDGVLYDASTDKRFATTLLELMARPHRPSRTAGGLATAPSRAFRSLLRNAAAALEPLPMRAEQSNTSIVFGDVFILKLYRRLEEGINPDLEIGRYLTEQRNFPNIAAVASALEYRRPNAEPTTLAILQSFLPNQGDAWSYTLDILSRYFQEALAQHAEPNTVSVPQQPLVALCQAETPPLAQDLMGFYLERIQLLGQRTGELHVALAQEPADANFAPETFTDFYRQGLYQSMLTQSNQAMQLLRRRLSHVPSAVQGEAQRVLDQEAAVRRRFRALRDRRITARRSRCHGDYHLGQVLYTGKDFIIIDFEGEPARPLSVRRIKSSPLRDVAGMLRSFHYAAYAALLGQVAGVRPEDFATLEPWARFWHTWVSVTFLRSYLVTATADAFLPQTSEELQLLLDAYLLEKALYELRYELNSRPDWVRIPLQGILQLLETA
jgi:maltose alpha-D-glucosyltransferase/alpha-amylase